jgi:hypothetical protein
MTIKLLLLKSGEDIISDISEMVVGEEEKRVVGYYLNKPCIVKMRNPNLIDEESDGKNQKAGFQVSLFPWIPLSKDEVFPIPADWIVTLVDPVTKLKEMYVKDVVNYGKNNQDISSDEQSDSDQ